MESVKGVSGRYPIVLGGILPIMKLIRLLSMVAAVVILAGLVTVTSSSANTPSAIFGGSVARLTGQGAVRWNLEALLRQEFRGKYVCVDTNDRSAIDFPLNNHACMPLSRYAAFNFDFENLGTSWYHLTTMVFAKQKGFANARPVLIGGRVISCDATDSEVLVALNDYPTFGLDCQQYPFQ